MIFFLRFVTASSKLRRDFNDFLFCLFPVSDEISNYIIIKTMSSIKFIIN